MLSTFVLNSGALNKSVTAVDICVSFLFRRINSSPDASSFNFVTKYCPAVVLKGESLKRTSVTPLMGFERPTDIQTGATSAHRVDTRAIRITTGIAIPRFERKKKLVFMRQRIGLLPA